MTVETHSNQKIISLSEDAKSYIAAWIKKENGLMLRLSIKDSGCNGLAYVTDIISEPNSNDIKESFPDLTIMIDPAAVKYISGTVIDYVVAENNLGLKKLIFKNPNASGECGCGESFNVDDPS